MRYPPLTIKIDVLRTAEALEQIAEEWHALVAGSQDESFSSPWWYLAWLDAFPVDALAIVTARDDGQLVGVLPLGRTRTDWRGMFMPRVGLFARGDFQPPVVDPRYLSTLLPMMLDGGREVLGKRHGLWWPNLLVGSEALEVVKAYCRGRGMPWIEEPEPAPRIEIQGKKYSELESAWSTSHRANIRRKQRKLASFGELQLWVPESLPMLLDVLEEFFEVHDRKWIAQGSPGMFHNPSNREHYRAIMRRMHGKGGYLSVLKAGATNVSYIFGFVAGGWLQYYRPTYNPTFAAASPTAVHLSIMLEHGCKVGWQGFDFLLGDEPYKLQWSTNVIDTVTITAGASRVSPSYLWFGKLRPLLKGRYAGQLARVRAILQRRGMQ